MLSRMRPCSRESIPFMVNGLRLVDSAMLPLQLYPIAVWDDGEPTGSFLFIEECLVIKK